MPSHVEVTLVYNDGREEVVKLKPKAWLAMERKWGSNLPAREAAMFGAWVQLAPGVDFDEWVDTLDSCVDRFVDPKTEATDLPVPSPPSP